MIFVHCTQHQHSVPVPDGAQVANAVAAEHVRRGCPPDCVVVLSDASAHGRPVWHARCADCTGAYSSNSGPYAAYKVSRHVAQYPDHRVYLLGMDGQQVEHHTARTMAVGYAASRQDAINDANARTMSEIGWIADLPDLESEFAVLDRARSGDYLDGE